MKVPITIFTIWAIGTLNGYACSIMTIYKLVPPVISSLILGIITLIAANIAYKIINK